ncbi:MAG: hypothetical protein LBV07_04180 [Syntrophobacterales bacterium]|jgi:predicted ABC-type ATPase|nr:hypothetical protein [Syntrophobacterales bacterium]
MDKSEGIFILSAGPNASGKSTVINPRYIDGRIKHRLDPDRLLPIARNDILSQESLNFYERGQSEKFAVSCMKDWLMSERIRKEGIGTESNLVSYRDFQNFARAKQARMRTELYFVGLPLATAIQREQIRANRGGQEKIDESIISRRYANGISNIKNHLESGNVDVVMVYDNSRGRGEEQLLLHIENGKPFFIHQDLPEWFKEAGLITPEMEKSCPKYKS